MIGAAAAVLAGVFASAAPAPRPPAPHAFPRLISTDSLAAWLARGPVRVVDIRTDVFTYLTSHLPSAVYVNTETLRASRGGIPVQLLDEQQYRRLFSQLGIAPDRPVVIYSAGETHDIDATFLAWLLASFGDANVYLLDGGYFKWQLEQRPLAQTYPRFPAATGWAARRFRPAAATIADVRSRGVTLVDARSPEQYSGAAGAQMRRGHIPGAINHYWSDDLEQEGFGHVWKPLDSLRASYVRQGITPDKDLILYCNSTTEATHVFFALRYLLAYPRVRIYTGSWSEWAERAELPIESGG